MTDGIFNLGTLVCDTVVIMNGGSPGMQHCQADGLIRHASMSVRSGLVSITPEPFSAEFPHAGWIAGALIKMHRYSGAPEESHKHSQVSCTLC